MDHSKKLFLEAVTDKKLKDLLKEHLVECVQKGENIILSINKAYAFHELNSRIALESLNKAINKVFGEEHGLILNLHVRNAGKREGTAPRDPTLKKSQKTDPKRTARK